MQHKASDSVTRQVQVHKTAANDFVLLFNTGKSRGTKAAHLTWTGSAAASTDVQREGTILASRENTGEVDNHRYRGERLRTLAP